MNSTERHEWIRKLYGKTYKVNESCTVKEIKACVNITIMEYFSAKIEMTQYCAEESQSELLKKIKKEWKESKQELEDL